MHKRVCVSEGKKCSFFEKIGVFCFLVTLVLKFALLPYYRQNKDFFLKVNLSTLNHGEKSIYKYFMHVFTRTKY